jgi:hypothetical protein
MGSANGTDIGRRGGGGGRQRGSGVRVPGNMHFMRYSVVTMVGGLEDAVEARDVMRVVQLATCLQRIGRARRRAFRATFVVEDLIRRTVAIADKMASWWAECVDEAKSREEGGEAGEGAGAGAGAGRAGEGAEGAGGAVLDDDCLDNTRWDVAAGRYESTVERCPLLWSGRWVVLSLVQLSLTGSHVVDNLGDVDFVEWVKQLLGPQQERGTPVSMVGVNGGLAENLVEERGGGERGGDGKRGGGGSGQEREAEGGEEGGVEGGMAGGEEGGRGSVGLDSSVRDLDYDTDRGEGFGGKTRRGDEDHKTDIGSGRGSGSGSDSVRGSVQGSGTQRIVSSFADTRSKMVHYASLDAALYVDGAALSGGSRGGAPFAGLLRKMMQEPSEVTSERFSIFLP